MKKAFWLVMTGVAIGILLAPDKGSETWKKLLGQFDELKDKALGEANDMKDKASDELNDIRDKAKEEVMDLTYRSKDLVNDGMNRVENEAAEW